MINRMYRKISLLFLLLFILSVPIIYAQQAPLNGLDQYIEKAMKDWNVPGLAVAVVKDDAVFFARGYGVREIGKPDKVNEHTLFAIASNTKAFTATLLAMLVDENKLNWDDHVIQYLRDFQLYDPYVTREINIEDLLTHRSGLPTYGGDHLWIGSSLSREEIIKRLRYLKPSAPFRTRYQYQNLMFLTAGQIIPAITGKGWDDFLKERIFEPLGMTESVSTMRELKLASNVARPHEDMEGTFQAVEYDSSDNTAPAGGIKSNVLDMSKWMRFNLGDGVFNGKKIINPETMRNLHSIHFPLPVYPSAEELYGTRFSGYGLGWSIFDYKGYKAIRHGGALTGMISSQMLIPEKNLGVIVLTNQAPNSLASAVTYRIIDAFLGDTEQDWSAIFLEREKQAEKRHEEARKKLEESRVTGTKPDLPLGKFAGTYANKLSGKATVTLENGKLMFYYNPRHRGELKHWHYNTFRLYWYYPIFDMPDETFLTFYLNDAGEVTKLETWFYHPITFKRIK